MAKHLKIKTGVLARIFKELGKYEEELVKEEAKTSKMREEGKDPHDIKHQEQVQEEAAMMVPDCKRRLEAALQDLTSYVDENKDDEEIAGSEELEKAQELLNNVNNSM
mmetsp:Transcript_5762/g.6619  ORF Transcript_5762/g.6619 Transcript_5762/m.6619 type:complete len:108 (-) Transcript_5762:605-928(-)|eukprot:CAMPEP_0197850544 /NCGR_PEP_ID=MMETSP1438-20131217/15670_1 /TAXON_ID=1461541 /ORGANISM="Pterosperma sp., Strain CCMP1384" /LENGTH=107 /DNA_ID=CAMNT_0043463757 /DNA_START=151 /DNA_END=474 /DNA_ORIENTATION=-